MKTLEIHYDYVMENTDKEHIEDELDEIYAVSVLLATSDPANVAHIIQDAARIIEKKTQLIKEILETD